MDFTVSENSNLLICECALNSVWVITEILVCGLVIFLGKHGWLLSRKVLGLEGLKVILDKTKKVRDQR